MYLDCNTFEDNKHKHAVYVVETYLWLLFSFKFLDLHNFSSWRLELRNLFRFSLRIYFSPWLCPPWRQSCPFLRFFRVKGLRLRVLLCATWRLKSFFAQAFLFVFFGPDSPKRQCCHFCRLQFFVRSTFSEAQDTHIYIVVAEKNNVTMMIIVRRRREDIFGFSLPPCCLFFFRGKLQIRIFDSKKLRS